MNPSIDRLERLHATSYLITAAATMIYYDYLLTLKHEVAMLKTGSLTLPKVLFYFSRYLALLIITIPIFDMTPYAPPSRRYCQISITTVNILTVVAQSFISATMGLKACAIWGNKKSISWIIWSTFVAVNAVSFTTTAFVTMGLYKNIQYSPIGHFCLATEKPKFSWFISAAQLLFDTVVTAVLCLKAYSSPDVLYSPGSPLLRIILTHGLMYFLLVDSSAVALTAVWAGVHEPEIAYAPLYLHLALTASMNSRSLFSLRESLDDIRTSQAIDGAVITKSKWGTVTAALRSMKVSRNPSQLSKSAIGRGSPTSGNSNSDRSSNDSGSSGAPLTKSHVKEIDQPDQYIQTLTYNDENEAGSIPMVPLTEVLLTPPRKRKALTVDSTDSFGAFGDFIVPHPALDEGEGDDNTHSFRFILNGVEMSLKEYKDVVESRV